MPVGYKPSPLGYGSPRSSPFRRQESPSVSPSSASRNTTPTPSPTKGVSLFTPSRFANPTSPTSSTTSDSENRTPRRLFQSETMASSSSTQPLASPAHISSASFAVPNDIPHQSHQSHQPHQAHQSLGQGSALSQLQPAQVRLLRDGFQIMDRDSDGAVTREDVADMLSQLGLPANASDISQFFPPGGPQTLTLAAFLNSIATALVALAPPPELLSAFSAFDDDDSGQVDVAELRAALLRTVPEPGERAPTAAEVDKIIAGFSGRKAFSKKSGGGPPQRRGEVFRYQEFVNSIMGGSNGGSESASNEDEED
ncbi:EF-hand [Xylaria arbuscula]|nr:EF-hand [Xylaria arbuscula]